MINLLKQYIVNYYLHILTEIGFGVYSNYTIIKDAINYINSNIYSDTETDIFINLLQMEQTIVFDTTIIPLGSEHLILT